ncbi:hypothetical protein KV557_00280 [Kitasatospora aureofaciens]|uniref:hypothetical protein n=1 Tax=Kitasatospora aureofaciens TaxID=1894 RepID=UPI001C447B84|nr:hypothetical protein [Kitasatospora aureofaciens]MBV6695563.1 hypothetical protein [Kitasatospora aureofaciens]
MTAAALFDFNAHPAALTDLDRLPGDVREAAVHHLRRLVRCQQRGPVLGRRGLWDLTGCRRVYLDRDRCWRLVYQERPPRPASRCGGEIYLLAAGPRSGHQVYNTAARRLQLLAAAHRAS